MVKQSETKLTLAEIVATPYCCLIHSSTQQHQCLF
jgi:hypothetical protein